MGRTRESPPRPWECLRTRGILFVGTLWEKGHPLVWSHCLETGPACPGAAVARWSGEAELGRQESPEVPLPAAESRCPSRFKHWLRERSSASPAYLTTLWASEGLVLVSGLPLFTGSPGQASCTGCSQISLIETSQSDHPEAPRGFLGLRDKNLKSSRPAAPSDTPD